MLTRSLPSRGRSFWFLLLTFVLVTVASCAPLATSDPIDAAHSVEEQLEQLAGSAEPAPTFHPAATRTERPTTAASQESARQWTSTPKPQVTKSVRATRTPSDGLPSIALAELPPEARRTILLIRQGGPFPFDKDGATFGNREGLLPNRPSGYYKEYTVITPGSRDRGARRIVAGREGELYYTGDHYDSFKRVIP